MSSNNSTTAYDRSKPAKPYPEFPLTAHPAGHWCKKIRGKIHYFGPWNDPFRFRHPRGDGCPGLPLGANDDCRTQPVLQPLLVEPPPPETPVAKPDRRDLPRASAEGADGNRPPQARAHAAGFRMEAPKCGRARQPGGGRIRSAAERGQAFLAQLGRTARRRSRASRRFLGWVQLAAALLFGRAEAHGFFQSRTPVNACFSR